MISAVECWDRGYCFPYDLWFDVGSFFVLVCCGYYWVVLATIGPRTTQELDFPAQAVNRLFAACMQWMVLGLCWLGWLVDGLINPTVLACWFVYSWLCVSLLVPYSLGNHAHLGGGSVAERLRSTLAYGWVERCSDVASCGTSFFQDKYSCMF